MKQKNLPIPKKLYKYRAFNEYTLQLLDRTEIYYADPRSFNDPIDSNPAVISDLNITQLERLFLSTVKARRGAKCARDEITHHRYMATEYGDYKTNADAKESYISNLTDSLVRTLREDIGACGILSLASKWDNPLMWSHYANDHRGICIEYSTTDCRFSNIGKINYNGPRAIRLSDVFAWRIEDDPEAKERVRTAIYFSKAADWRYEGEWRDLTDTSGVYPAPGPPSSVLFGHRCDLSIMRVVIRLFKDAEFPLKFYVVRPSEQTFKFKRYKIDTEEILSEGVRMPAGWEFRESI